MHRRAGGWCEMCHEEPIWPPRPISLHQIFDKYDALTNVSGRLEAAKGWGHPSGESGSGSVPGLADPIEEGPPPAGISTGAQAPPQTS